MTNCPLFSRLTSMVKACIVVTEMVSLSASQVRSGQASGSVSHAVIFYCQSYTINSAANGLKKS